MNVLVRLRTEIDELTEAAKEDDAVSPPSEPREERARRAEEEGAVLNEFATRLLQISPMKAGNRKRQASPYD